MAYSRKDVDKTKQNAKKFVRYQEGAEKYSMGLTKFTALAKEAKAVYKIDKVTLVNCEIFERYLESGQCDVEIDGMTGFIFCNRFGNVPNPQSVNRAIKRIIADYNATEEVAAKKQHREAVLLPDFSAHHLRHTFCTRLCENETNLKVIQSVMGHKDIQTTMDVYAEATEQKKQESFERLAAKLDIF